MDPAQGRLLIRYGIHPEILLSEHISEIIFQFFYLIHNQNRLAASAGLCVLVYVIRCTVKGQINGKDTARPHLTGHSNGSAHHFRKASGDGKAKSCAAIIPGNPAVFLRKRFKYTVDILRCDSAAGVLNLKAQPYPVIITAQRFYVQVDTSLRRGKFHSVGEQIRQYLVQAKRIANQILRDLSPKKDLKVYLPVNRLHMEHRR